MMVDRQLEILSKLSTQAIAAAIPSNDGPDQNVSKDHILIGIDPVRLPRSEVVKVTDGLQDRIDWSNSGTSTENEGLVLIETQEDGVCRVASPGAAPSPKAYQSGEDYILENAHFKLTISKGRIASLVDIPLQRELILAGSSAQTGGLMLYDDFPTAYDAWDAEIYHLDCVRVLDFAQVEVVANGPLRASLRATAKFGKSAVAMTVSRSCSRLRFSL
jgi:alpha-mannosidase